MTFKGDKRDKPWVVIADVPVETPYGKCRADIRMYFTTRAEMDACIIWVKNKLALGLIDRVEVWHWAERTKLMDATQKTYHFLKTASGGRPAKVGKTKVIK